MSADAARAGSDLARRIAEQRQRSGLTVEQVAARAGMSAEYLRYLEASSAPNLSSAGMTRLAAALNVGREALSGATSAHRPGRGTGAAAAILTAMTASECRDRLAVGGIGRVVFDEPGRGPVAIPVNYQMDGDDVIIRTQPGHGLAASAVGGRVSFDVDHIDDALAEGWSVLLTGRARLVTEPAELRRLAGLGIQPWPGADREAYVRLVAEVVTGRRLRAAGA